MITRCIMIAALIVVPLAASADIISSAMTSVFPSYELILTYRNDRLVLDHGLTQEDCVDALPHDDPRKHVSFTCEEHH